MRLSDILSEDEEKFSLDKKKEILADDDLMEIEVDEDQLDEQTRLAWARKGRKLVRKIRCGSGRRKGRLVSKASQCGRTIWGDPERFKKSYYPEELGGKVYLAGDGAIRDKTTGYFTIMGRIDDVLSVSGHRLGTMEIESSLVSNPLVAEAAVVGKPHEIKGESIVAYVVLKGKRPEGEEAKTIVSQLREWVGKEIGPIAKPDDIRFGDNLPKTRSGKIMRRLLRSLAKGEEITSDISTLDNPSILEQLKQTIQ